MPLLPLLSYVVIWPGGAFVGMHDSGSCRIGLTSSLSGCVVGQNMLCLPASLHQ